MRQLLILLMVLGIFLVGCMPPSPGQEVADHIKRWHDDVNEVTCWIYTYGAAGGISCLPDAQIGGK